LGLTSPASYEHPPARAQLDAVAAALHAAMQPATA